VTQRQFLIEFASILAVLFPAVLVAYLEARWVVHRWRHRAAVPRPRFWPRLLAGRPRLWDWTLHAAFALGLACAVDAFFIEPGLLEVQLVELRSDRIRPETGKIRVVQLSDLHSEGRVLNEARAAEVVDYLKPDLIVMTGDYVNGPEGLPVFERMVHALRAPLGVYVVAGNYDLHEKGLERSLRSLPVHWLRANAREIEVRGTRLRIVGMDADSEHFARPLLAPSAGHGPVPPFTILLYHYSDLAFEAADAGVDLYLSGHTHGGQVRLPWYGALVTLAKYGKRFESGLYKVGDMALYVSRGIGLEGRSAPRVRFLCRPEITAFDLLPEEGS